MDSFTELEELELLQEMVDEMDKYILDIPDELDKELVALEETARVISNRVLEIHEFYCEHPMDETDKNDEEATMIIDKALTVLESIENIFGE